MCTWKTSEQWLDISTYDMLAVNIEQVIFEHLVCAGAHAALSMQQQTRQMQAWPQESPIRVLIQHLGPTLPQVFFRVCCPF